MNDRDRAYIVEDPSHVEPRGSGLRRVERSAVIRLLAAGMQPEAVARRVSEQFGAHQRFSLEDLQALLSETAAILDERRLLPPAEAAFSETYGSVIALAALRQERPRLSPQEAAALRRNARMRPTTDDLDQLGILARRLIQAYIAHGGGSRESPQPRTAERQNVALQYAEALLRQEEILEYLQDAGPEDSPLQAALTGSDRRRVDDFLLYHNLMGRFETLDSLVDQWERSVVWVDEDPESYGHEEFSDRLISRDSLEDALVLISPGPRQPLAHRIGKLDDRFFAATGAVSTSIRPCSPWRPQRWWWFRVPRPSGKQFSDRLTEVAPAAARDARCGR